MKIPNQDRLSWRMPEIETSPQSMQKKIRLGKATSWDGIKGGFLFNVASQAHLVPNA